MLLNETCITVIAPALECKADPEEHLLRRGKSCQLVSTHVAQETEAFRLRICSGCVRKLDPSRLKCQSCRRTLYTWKLVGCSYQTKRRRLLIASSLVGVDDISSPQCEQTDAAKANLGIHVGFVAQ